MPTLVDNLNPELRAVRDQISSYNGWFIGVGILLALLGVAAIAFPLLSTIAAAVWVGWSLLIGGSLIFLNAVVAWRWPDSVWNLGIGLLYTGAGAMVLYALLTSIFSLTLIIAAVFLAEGVIEIILAFRLRELGGWGWMLFSGLAAVAAGVLLAYEFPSSAAWALGLLFGVNLLSTGSSFVAIAVACRGALDTPSRTALTLPTLESS